jgi:hypothetical protein
VALRTREVVLHGSAADATAFRVLANALLRDGTELPWTSADDHRTPSLVAWRLYDDGRAALARWDLVAAATTFRRALALEADLAPAQLWSAQASAWADPDHPALWRDAASRAVAALDRLTPDDTLVARGVYALSLARQPDACAAYAALHASAPRDPVAWLGLGQCRMSDEAVLRDARSPSGWRFRSSYHSAALAYDSAIHRAVGTPAFAFRALDRLLFTQPWRIREGHAASPDTLTFGAYATLIDDTLALVPWPRADMGAGTVRYDRSLRAAALRTNGRRLGMALEEWTRRDTASADAREMLARLQEVRGDEDGDGLVALRTVAAARRLSRDSAQRIELAITQLRLLVKTSDFVHARGLADSLLAANARATGYAGAQLAAVAALVGRLDEAARLLQQTAALEDSSVPPAVATRSARYLVLAAAGVCDDELRHMDGSIDDLLQRYVADDLRPAMRRATVGRAQGLAVPCLGPGVALGVPAGDALTRMQQALARGRADDVRRELDALAKERAGIRPGDVSLDRTCLEAWMLAQIGDTTAAIHRLDLTLTAMTTLGTALMRDLPQAAAVGRTMALRAELAAATGDSVAAQRWAQNVVTLWNGASPGLQATVTRMQSLAERPRAK